MSRKASTLSSKSINSSNAYVNMLKKHDERKFVEFKKSAEKLLESEGFDNSSIRTVSKKMTDEFRAHAIIDDDISQGKINLDSLKRDPIYVTKGKKLPRVVVPLYEAILSVARSLDEDPLSAFYKTLWYKEYLIKNRTNSIASYLKTAWYLFREQEQKFGWKTALEITPYLIIAGLFGHDKRNTSIAIKYFAICNENIKRNRKAGFIH